MISRDTAKQQAMEARRHEHLWIFRHWSSKLSPPALV